MSASICGDLCGLAGQPPELPDAGEGMCCYGAAIFGPERCTCWEPVYDLKQQEIKPGLPLPRIPVAMCSECAYKPNSPERRGEDGYKGDTEELDRLVATGEPFVCHVGIRKPLKWRHPSGAEIPGHPAGYDPPIVDGIPYKADGAPADVCSGWLLRRVKEAQR